MTERAVDTVGARLWRIQEKFLRPQRASLELASEISVGLRDGQEAWEAMSARGLIPEHWIGALDRGFACVPCAEGPLFLDGFQCMKCRGTTVALHPAKVRSAVLLASDPRGITTAEFLARECVRALQRWGVQSGQKICWRFAKRERLEGFRTKAPACFGAPRVALSNVHGVDFPPSGPTWLGWYLRAWELAVQEGRKVEVPSFPVAGQRFSELPNPFEMLAELWELGYLLEGVKEGVVQLVGPET